jgi:hypothetical protein
MSGRVTPAVRAPEMEAVRFELLKHDYDPAAADVGMPRSSLCSWNP